MAMRITERALAFPCAGEQLLGIITAPEEPKATGVIIIVGGPQYRVGSHRQFLLLARTLAGAGYPVMRFDYRGMGDSSGDHRDFRDIVDDVGASIAAFQHTCPQVRQVVLWGLCDAASAALMYWHQTRDDLIKGLCLLNPWVRSETTLARTRVKHYYAQRLMQREFWQKVFGGKLAVGTALFGFVKNLCLSAASPRQQGSQTLSFQEVMANAFGLFDSPILLVLSGNDHTAQEFLEYAAASARLSEALRRTSVDRRDLPDADHTFSKVQWRDQVEELTIDWLHKISSRP